VVTTDLTTRIEDAISIPREQWAMRCHEISLAIVRTMFEPGDARVARGFCKGVPSQHSWVVTDQTVEGSIIGADCYDERCIIWDSTWWSYTGGDPEVWTTTTAEGFHTPHGTGSIWQWGRPNPATGPVVTLTPRKPWTPEAELFLSMLGPLDREGWIMLAHAPVEKWPAAEIIDAMCESGLEGYVPIDIVGMLTDRNPSGVYMRGWDDD
jgi:hypothetical protein